MRPIKLITAFFAVAVFAAPPLTSEESDTAIIDDCKTKVLNSSTVYKVAAKYTSALDLYGCPGMRWHLKHAFVDVHLHINISDNNDYQLYQGNNCSTVLDAYAADTRLFGLLRSVSLWRSLQLAPFNRTVIGIATSEPYELTLKVDQVSIWRTGLYFGGILLFLFAPALTRNALFYYTGGCSVGVFASLIVVIIVIYRFIPKKTIGVPILIGGSSAASWMLFHAWSNFSVLLVQYQQYVAAYFITVLLISLAYCYKHGPPSDERSLNLLQWTFQAVACGLIYASSHVTAMTYATIAIMVLYTLVGGLARQLFQYIMDMWRYFFPRPRPLLSEDEYQREAADYTKKELARLRDYCRSPAADSWRITSSLKKPKRMARFVDGTAGHLTPAEISLHEEAITDDDSDEDERRRPVGGPFYDPDEFDEDEEEAYAWQRDSRIRRQSHNASGYHSSYLPPASPSRSRLMSDGGSYRNPAVPAASGSNTSLRSYRTPGAAASGSNISLARTPRTPGKQRSDGSGGSTVSGRQSPAPSSSNLRRRSSGRHGGYRSLNGPGEFFSSDEDEE